MMKQKKTSVILAAVLTVLTTLTACSAGDEAAQEARGGMPIVLSTAVGGGTRSTLQQSQLAGGETVKVWAKYTGDSWAAEGNVIDSWLVTADGSGGLSGDTRLYPLRATAYTLDFVAVHGTNLGTISDGTMPFSVRLDQNSTADYAASDLLVATKSAVAPSMNAVPLDFSHKLAKIEVRVTSSKFSEASLMESVLVKVKAVPSGTVNLSTGAVTTDTKTADNYQKIIARRVTTSDAYYDSDECSGLHFEAVIPEQAVSETEITVNMLGIDVPVSRSSTAGSYEAGNTYTYTVDLTTALTAPVGVELSAVTSSHVGWVIAEDGKAYDPGGAKFSLLVQLVGRPVAVIAYVGSGDTQGADGSAGGAASSGFSHGLGLALEDCGSGNCNWSDPNNASSAYQRWCDQISSVCLPRRTKDVATVITYLDGLSCTGALVGHASHVGTHYAAIAASTYQYGSSVSQGAHPANTSGWFLPSMGQWNLMVKSMCASGSDLTDRNNSSNNASAFNPLIVAAGGTGVQADIYWSSTEYTENMAWRMYFVQGMAGYGPKTYGYNVRAVLAF